MEIKIELTEQTYKRLLFLKEKNYFKPMTENDVIADLINSSYEEYQETIKALKEER